MEIEVEHGVGFVVGGETQSDRLMVVGYLQSRHFNGEPPETSTERGDPAMYQTVPTDAFGTRFAVTPGLGFFVDYVQLVRGAGGATVFVDGVGAASWVSLGEFEYADIVVTNPITVLESDAPFSVTQFGYTDPDVLNPDCLDPNGVCNSSYAHPAGWVVPSRR